MRGDHRRGGPRDRSLDPRRFYDRGTALSLPMILRIEASSFSNIRASASPLYGRRSRMPRSPSSSSSSLETREAARNKRGNSSLVTLRSRHVPRLTIFFKTWSPGGNVEASLELIADCYRCTKEYRALGERREGSAFSISRYFATYTLLFSARWDDGLIEIIFRWVSLNDYSKGWNRDLYDS